MGVNVVGPGGATTVITGTQTPGDTLANPADAADVRAFLQAWNGAAWYRVNTQVTGDASPDQIALVEAALSSAWSGTAGAWQKLRTAAFFKTAVATALGTTTIWTPAAGRKFRLLAYSIEVTGNASMAAAGLNEITLQDSGAAIGQGVSAWLPAAAGTTLGNVSLTGGMRQIGNGFLSGAANNVLQVNLGVALATGEVRVNAIGTEE